MFHIYSSNQREDKFNVIYEREFEIDNEELLAEKACQCLYLLWLTLCYSSDITD